jgi:mono/diheme cytochrome c family protein
MTKFVKISILFSAAFLVWACSSAPAPNNATSNINTTKPPVAQASPAADALAQGKKLYTDNCAACHKENGTGGKIEFEGKSINPDDLTTAKIKAFSDDKIIGYIYKGIESEGMPSFKDTLTEAEIREVVRYVRGGIQKMPEPASTKPAS